MFSQTLVEENGLPLNLYCLERCDVKDAPIYGEFATMIVAAPSEAVARTIRPEHPWLENDDLLEDYYDRHGFHPIRNTWNCQFIGMAAACLKQGVISYTFNGD